MEHDCILELDTNELDHFLENGDEPKDLGTCYETMLEIANKKGKAICIFTVYKSATPPEIDD